MRNAEGLNTYKAQLEAQRENFTKVLELTERRVVQANVLLSQVHGEFQDEGRKQASEYLSAQVYQLCEERRRLLDECDQLKQKNGEL